MASLIREIILDKLGNPCYIKYTINVYFAYHM